jgi:hypothetical protein
VIQRRDRHADTDEAKGGLAHSGVTDGLFFSKGRATAHAFRRTYWSHGAPPAAEEQAALDDEPDGFSDDSQRPDAAAARTEEPQWSGPPMRQAPYTALREDTELAGLERAFIAGHLPVLVQEPEPEPDGDTAPSELPSFSPENPEFRAPEADLRTVVLFRSRREEAPSDELFMRKNHAVADTISATRSHDPNVTSIGAAHAGAVIAAPERLSPVPRDIPPAHDHTASDLAPVIDTREPAAAKVAATPAARLPDPAPAVIATSEPPATAAATTDARPDQSERPRDTHVVAAPLPASNARRPALGSVQVAIFAFGCMALLVSFETFFLSSPAQPRNDVVTPSPQIVAAPPPPPAVAVSPPPVVALSPPPVVAAPPPPVEAAQQPLVAAPVARPPAEAVDDLVARGDQCLRTGDVFAARLFYERAADAGNAHGALMVGATYDPAFLASIGVHGLQGDTKAAATWYGRAAVLGDPDAAKLQKSLQHR